jgi:hypothetical protein
MNSFNCRLLAVIGAAAAGILTGQTRLDLSTQSRNIDFSGAQATKPFKTGSVLPGVCSTGEAFFVVSALPGRNLYTCIAPNTWVAQGSALPQASGPAGQVLSSTGEGASEWRSLSGDLSGALSGRVTGIQGNAVSDVKPTDGQILVWDNTASQWVPKLVPAGSSEFTMQMDGVTFGSGSIYNVITGTGMVSAVSAGSGTVNVQQNVNTAIIQTRAGAQSGADLIVNVSSESNSEFTGRMTPTLTAYSDGMLVQFRPNQDCSSGATLNVDTLGAKPMFESDGVAPMTCTAGEQIGLWYDAASGGRWRKQGARVPGGESGGGMTDPGANGIMLRTSPNVTAVVSGNPTHFVRVDGTSTAVTAAAVGLGNVENHPVASQAEAEAGTATNRYMTPERTKQAITAQRGNVVPDPGVNGVVVRTALNASGVVTGSATDFVRVNGTSAAVNATTVGLDSVQNYPVASQAEAEAGTAADRYMTPERVRQAITAQRGNSVADPGANGVMVRTGPNATAVVNGNATDLVRVDGTATAVNAAVVGLGSVQNYPVATQAEAVAGTAADRYMTPERTRQSLAGTRTIAMQATTGASSTSVGGGATVYVPIAGQAASQAFRRGNYVPVSGTIRNAGMAFLSQQTDPAMTCTLVYSQGSPWSSWTASNVSITVNAASTSGASSNSPRVIVSPNTLAVNAGWMIAWECVNSSPTTSATYYLSFANLEY